MKEILTTDINHFRRHISGVDRESMNEEAVIAVLLQSARHVRTLVLYHFHMSERHPGIRTITTGIFQDDMSTTRICNVVSISVRKVK